MSQAVFFFVELDNPDTTSNPDTDEYDSPQEGGFLSGVAGFENTPSMTGRKRLHDETSRKRPLWVEKQDYKPECRSDIRKVMGQISRRIKDKHNHMMAATQIIVKVCQDILDEL